MTRQIWKKPTVTCSIRTMISVKRVALVVLLCAGAAAQSPADHIPQAPDDPLDYQVRLGAMLKIEKWNPFLEIRGRLEHEENALGYRAITLGSYFRPHGNIKLGAFYRLQQGSRHDNDWIGLDPGWAWLDTGRRTEHILILDVSPRVLLDFLPGENWVFMIKNRYLFNTYNSQHTWKVRPGMTYFFLKDRSPLLNMSINYEIYLSLNFGESIIYQHWPYLTLAYHISRNAMLDLSLAYKTVKWSTSRDVIESGESGYQVDVRSFLLGAGVLFTFQL